MAVLWCMVGNRLSCAMCHGAPCQLLDAQGYASGDTMELSWDDWDNA